MGVKKEIKRKMAKAVDKLSANIKEQEVIMAEINTLSKQMYCKHKWKDLGSSTMLESECNKCGYIYYE